ncbi:intestinal mucin-like protein, partial [Eleutherodactylus coqui]|uniref:intestinal mucin-like protein n=1 Tax=Eleutherodactylus coqui TaxID=57060 RepID=UPI003461CFB7
MGYGNFTIMYYSAVLQCQGHLITHMEAQGRDGFVGKEMATGHLVLWLGALVFSDKCKNCECAKSNTTSTGLDIICTPVPCNVQCPMGFELTTSERDCCGVCKQTHCVLNHGSISKLIAPNVTLHDENNHCIMYTCTVIRNQFISSVSEISCPPFDESQCEPGTVEIQSNGCCKICIEKTSGCHLERDTGYMFYNN